MAFCTYSKEYSATGFTDLENAFINDYMPAANGTAVKVYVYGLYLCRNTETEFTLESFAEALGITAAEAKDAFIYWEEFGLVSITADEPFRVKYLPLGTSAKPRKIKPEKYAGFSASLQLLIPSRMISTSEFTEYYNIMEIYGIKQEAMLMILKYCVGLKGESIGYKYISAVAKDFGARKILTAEQVEKELSSYVSRSAEIEKILKAMSLKKKPEIEDLNYYKKWTKELGYETENIIYAATKIKKGGMKKLDDFIGELYANKRFSKEEIAGYSKTKDNLYDLTIKINRALSVYYDVIDTVVENYTARWHNMGFEERSLLFIANYCFKKNKNNYEAMDEIIARLQQNGVVGYEATVNYFVRLAEEDAFIKEMLSLAGITRKPTNWDRDNLKLWQSWNFSKEMILEAAKRAAGKESPIPYINAVLGRWKDKGVFTPDKIENAPEKRGGKHFANERTYTEQELDKLIDNIADIEF